LILIKFAQIVAFLQSISETDQKFLYHVTGKNKATRYGVGVGREGFAWNGDATIKRKAKWPTWTPPAEMRAREKKKGIILPITQKGGIDNSGCIRMLNKDVEHLYEKVKLGSKVVVVGPGQKSARGFSENVNPFAALFGAN